MKRLVLCLALLPLACVDPAPSPRVAGPPEEADEAVFADTIRPLLQRYCVSCHGDDEPEMGLNLEALTPRGSRRAWRQVRIELEDEGMPPPEEAQPTPAERRRLLAWLNGLLGPDETPPAPPPGLRRLNRVEYERTVRDLLGVHLPLARELPDDDVGYGFDTVGDVLALPPALLERYLLVAERVADEAIRVREPLRLRLEAETLERTGRGGRARDGFVRLTTNGSFTASVRIRSEGRYQLRLHAYGDQAGPDPVRLNLSVDGERVAGRELREDRRAPALLEETLELARGEHTVRVAFINDWWRPQNPPHNRDRNFALDYLELEGPEETPPTAAYRRIIPVDPAPGEELQRASEQLRALADRAFRRPARPALVKRLVALVRERLTAGESYPAAMRLALQALLVTPQFLFHLEPDPEPAGAPGEPYLLDEHALAARLSYFLWSSLPDAALRAQADAGTLRRNLAAETRRLLDDPRAGALVEHFAGQWLQLRRLAGVDPDPARFPDFDEELRAAMRVESELLFEAVMREDRSVLDLLDAPFSFVNERLARHYGIPGVEGPRFRRVRLPPERAGVLSHASVLALTSGPTRTSPVLRGKWILEQLLDDPPPPPPPGADAVADDEAARAEASLRERLEQHRRDPRCASCHARMDALGFVLEGYDAVGALRERDGPFPIDTRGELPDGTRLEGPPGLRRYLREHADAFVRCLGKKLLIYALGRGTGGDDEAELAERVAGLGPEYRFQELVVALVQTRAFQTRRRGWSETETESESESEPATEEF